MEFDDKKQRSSLGEGQSEPDDTSSAAPSSSQSHTSHSPALSALGLPLPSSQTEIALEQLQADLAHEKWSVRVAAIRQMARQDAQIAIPALLSALSDEQATVRAAAVRSLGKFGTATSIEPLQRMLQDTDWNVRATTLIALAKWGTDVPIEPLISALGDLDESVRAAAVYAIGARGEHTPIAPLVSALHDYSWSVREATVQALGNLGKHAPQGSLQAALQDTDAQVRQAARTALQQIQAETPMLAAQIEQHVDAETHTPSPEQEKSQAIHPQPTQNDETVRVIDFTTFRTTGTVSPVSSITAHPESVHTDIDELRNERPDTSTEKKESVAEAPSQTQQASPNTKTIPTTTTRKSSPNRRTYLAARKYRSQGRFPGFKYALAVVILIGLGLGALSLSQIMPKSDQGQLKVTMSFYHHDPTNTISQAIWVSDGISPNTSDIAFANSKGYVEVWNTSTQQLLHRYGPFAKVFSLTSLDNRVYIADQTSHGTIEIREGETLKYVLKTATSSKAVGSFTPDGTRFAFAPNIAGNNSIEIWDTLTGQPGHQSYSAQPGTITMITWPPAPHDNIIASVSKSGPVNKIEIWNPNTGISLIPAQPYPYISQYTDVVAMAWSPDSERLAYMFANGLVSIRDLQTDTDGPLTYNQPSTLSPPQSSQGAIAWSPDSKYLATTSLDNQVQIWDASYSASTGTLVNTYSSIAPHVNTLIWAPDGNKRIACVSSNGTLWVWQIE